MIDARRAAVKPRVVSSETHEVILLEELIGSCAEQGCCGAVEIVSGPRSGKTTALAHLASMPFAGRLVLLDNAGGHDVRRDAREHLVVYTTRRPLNLDQCDFHLELAPWSDDDLIEYLLATHPDCCASVMARFTADPNRTYLDGEPELYCVVAEQMAADVTLRDIGTALRRGVAERALDEPTLVDARFYSSAVVLNQSSLAEAREREMLRRGVAGALFALIGHYWVQILLTADRITSLVREEGDYFPAGPLPRQLVNEIAAIVAGDADLHRRLIDLLYRAGKQIVASTPMIASVLFRIDPQWRPRDRFRYLAEAYFPGARWDAIDLRWSNLEHADLSGADLRGADLDRVRVVETSLRGSRLSGARLEHAIAYGADFSGADLSQAVMPHGRFVGAELVQSKLDKVSAHKADFHSADLRGATFCNADLRGCDFRTARLDGVDFQDADLRDANLTEQDLQSVRLAGADMSRCILARCNLELVDLPGAQLNHANLVGAYLTGSVMPGADLRGAHLVESGLADVQWENADLRDADLTNSAFHLGSSRSGLVGSPYPCHGSRTGFYTNDYDDQTYKAPEEIRKANLCGADLRGARVTNVDFYLVDLRGAKYDADQAEHFRRCDAIL